MTDTPNPAPAGAGDAPASTPADTSILDRHWEGDPGLPEDAEAEAVAEEEEAPSPETETPEPEGEGDEEISEEGEDEEPADDAAEADAKDKPDDEDETGSRMHRLRDGTSVSLADLKRGFDDARQFRAALPQIQQERQTFQQEREQFQAQQQQLQPILATAAQILQSQIPAEPDPNLQHSDPIEWIMQNERRRAALTQLQSVNQARQQQEQQAQYQTTAQLQVKKAQAIAAFVQARPEYRADEKAKEFSGDLRAVVKACNFSDQDLQEIYDSRLYEMARLAAIGLKAEQTSKQAAVTQTQKKAIAFQKVAKAPPVQAPAARQSQGTRAGQVARGNLERLRKTGSVTDAEAFLSQFE